MVAKQMQDMIFRVIALAVGIGLVPYIYTVVGDANVTDPLGALILGFLPLLFIVGLMVSQFKGVF
jgi:hypothetical protein